ncbi:MAG: hypothetical protein ACJA07_004483 [Rhodococcus sp. (in: high G+C Gram-positive bacteria)]
MKLTVADRERFATAIHEAGHAVAVVLAGDRIVDLRLNDGDVDAPGQCTHQDVPENEERGVAFAGPWSEERWRRGARPTPQQLRASLDRNGSDAAFLEASAGVGADPREVEPILEAAWPAVKQIARELFIRGHLQHDDVAHELGLDGTAHDHSVVASIRSGILPVPAWLPI